MADASERGLPFDERYEPPARVRERAYYDAAGYAADYQRSITGRDGFWAEKANEYLDWIEPFTSICEEDLYTGRIAWFLGGKLNVSANCLDRHLATRGGKTAILWEGDEPGLNRRVTYQELHGDVCRLANALKQRGVVKGDRVAIYMGMVPELAVAMLACARIGAIHSVIFGGFSAQSISDRVIDAEAVAIITQDEGRRGSRPVPLKANVDRALESAGTVKTVIVYKRASGDVPMQAGRDEWWDDVLAGQPSECEPEPMDSEDPLFILYTSGSTGKPKGVLHTQAGYLLQTAFTHKVVFDVHEDDIYCCAADVGWITGHSYIVYGPLANGATTVMFESIPSYPDSGRYWDMVDRLGISIFYTAPTAIRSLIRDGDEHVTRYSRRSLRVLGTVGEPINPEAWRWYFNVVGEGRCSIVDTYWQTETGGHVLTGLAGATVMKPGSASNPFFGIEPVLVNEQGVEVEGNDVSGHLCIRRSWPGMMRTVYGDHGRFVQTYFSQYPGRYFTGDGAIRDVDGYYWLTGRVDDVLNVSGHRLGTAEIEGALVQHPSCAEAAVVGYPHDIKGVGVHAYVLLNAGEQPSEELAKELRMTVRTIIGPIAQPDRIQFVEALPKTRSGKIMRRILRKIAEGDASNLGDTTTLAEPGAVDTIKAGLAKTY